MNNKAHISLIPAILKAKGVEHIVIAPGSRNAPLIQAFYKVFEKACMSIVDERSAAYYALGIALKTRTTVVVITTSGTAALNLAPAIAEAFHQGVALLALTADRPLEWIDQQDNQVIRQKNIFSNNCKASFELPIQVTIPEELWYVNRIVNQAYNDSVSGKNGPVHINIPLREPLYDELPETENIQIIDKIVPAIYDIEPELIEIWNASRRIQIICGQHPSDEKINSILNKTAVDGRVVVLAESISNISGEKILENPDLMFQINRSEIDDLMPDLVIYYGGQLVSKRLKKYLKDAKIEHLWYISPEGLLIDTFQGITKVIQTGIADFFNALYKKANIEKQVNYSNKWFSIYRHSIEQIENKLSAISFSDLWVLKQLSEVISSKDLLFIGNSSVIRYLQFFENHALEVFSNRGTSGIDGCISTAAGVAIATKKKVIAIVGDLSFVYDSNGLWNKNLPENLKIVVVNNKGGGIFSLIDGPSKQEGFEDFFEAYHPVSIKKISEAFGVQYFSVSEKESFEKSYKLFYKSDSTAILEIETLKEINTEVFNNFVQNL